MPVGSVVWNSHSFTFESASSVFHFSIVFDSTEQEGFGKDFG